MPRIRPIEVRTMPASNGPAYAGSDFVDVMPPRPHAATAIAATMKAAQARRGRDDRIGTNPQRTDRRKPLPGNRRSRTLENLTHVKKMPGPASKKTRRPMSTPIIDEAAKVFADPTSYADEPRLHAALTHLRAHAPVSLVDCPPYRPFWAITKHADIMHIERANDLFVNEPRPLLATTAADDMARAQLNAGMGLRTLIHMDDPQHRGVRAIGADWFRPKAMRALKIRVDELAKIYVDKMMAAGNECDFVQEVAVNYPLYVIMSLLGLPEADFPRMLKLTQELFGSDDSEFKRGSTEGDQLPALLDMFQYFNAVTASRREHPTEDLSSAIANARVDGEPLSDIDTVSYYLIVATAGHDTTSATISGVLQALIENPDQLVRLRDNPDLMPLATEEMIRWVTPGKAV